MLVIRGLLVLLTISAAAIVTLALLTFQPAGPRVDLASASPPPSSPEASVQPTPEPTVEPPAAADGTECGTAYVTSDRAEPTIAHRSEASVAVVVATIESIGDPRWNTSDEEPPAIADGIPPRSTVIYRPVDLAAVDALGIDASGSPIGARLLGGTVGCYTFVFDGPTVELGGTYAIFLGPSVDAAGGAAGPDPTMMEAWPVRGSAVITPVDGDVPLIEFLARAWAALEAAPQ